MQLELESGEIYQNPDAGTIAKALTFLDGKRASFAILSRTRLTYLQVSGSPREGFALEYQDGSIDKHFSSPLAPSFEEVINIFQSYARGDDQWLDAGRWEPMNLKSKRSYFAPGKIKWNKYGWLYLVPFTICGVAVFFGHGKNDGSLRFRAWSCVFWASIAAFILLAQWRILKRGSYRRGFRTVYRAKSPLEFYSSVVFGFIVAVAVIILAVLLAFGRIG